MNEIKGFFDEYAKFVDDVTSEIGKKDELFMERAAEISRWLDGNFSRMRWQVWPAKRERSETCGKS